MLVELDNSVNQSELRERVYRGEILCFRKLPAIMEFCRITRSIAETNLKHDDPRNSYRDIDHSQWINRVHRYQLAARADHKTRQAFSAAIESLGLPLSDTFCDRIIFRVVPPQGRQTSGSQAWVDIHRDTWGAGIYQQINWWAPLLPYPVNSGIKFYPQYFHKAIKNSSAQWNYQDYLKARKNTPAELNPDYKSIPSLLESPLGDSFSPQINPGDLLCFSAAHLHGSNINNSDVSRFSFETRTVNLEDIASGMFAPNHDNASDSQLLNLFHNMANDSSLTAAHFSQNKPR